MNLTEQPLKLKAGSTIGTFTAVEADEEDDKLLETKSQKARVDSHYVRTHAVPKHLPPLCDAAKGGCNSSEGARMLATLLTKYSVGFSMGDGDVGHTALVEHSISILEWTRPIHMPPHRLAPEKEAEAEIQV